MTQTNSKFKKIVNLGAAVVMAAGLAACQPQAAPTPRSIDEVITQPYSNQNMETEDIPLNVRELYNVLAEYSDPNNMPQFAWEKNLQHSFSLAKITDSDGVRQGLEYICTFHIPEPINQFTSESVYPRFTLAYNSNQMGDKSYNMKMNMIFFFSEQENIDAFQSVLDITHYDEKKFRSAGSPGPLLQNLDFTRYVMRIAEISRSNPAILKSYENILNLGHDINYESVLGNDIGQDYIDALTRVTQFEDQQDFYQFADAVQNLNTGKIVGSTIKSSEIDGLARLYELTKGNLDIVQEFENIYADPQGPYSPSIYSDNSLKLIRDMMLPIPK